MLPGCSRLHPAGLLTMGDKEGCMEEEEAEEVEEKETKVVLHCPPLYPLPEEIQKMERSETACRYCGVSYLILHEFHQLHTQLAQREAELQEAREASQREKAQREALKLGRLERERALQLEVQRQAEVRERNRDTVTTLRDQHERKRREEEEKEKEELERRREERGKVGSDALHTANKDSEELRKNLQQLEERLAIAAVTREEAEQVLGKEKQQGDILRGVCVRQQQALRATLALLRSSGRGLADVRGLLSRLTRAWQAFRCQILQHSARVLSALREEQQRSSVELQRRRAEAGQRTQQLMEQRRQREEQLSQQEHCEKEHRGHLLRFKVELEEKHERWLSCQRRCDAVQEQLSLRDQRAEQMNRMYCAAVEEVTQLREALQRIQQEARELRTERPILLESHGRALTEAREDYRRQLATKLSAALQEQSSQSALHLRNQVEELRREAELELTIDREKNQSLLLQCRQDSAQLQQKLEQRELEVQELQEELQQERRIREDEEEMHQQEALQPSQANAEPELMAEKNAELQAEVALLQDTVRRECEEREELTAALCRAQQELHGLRSPASHQGSSRPPPAPVESHTPSGNKNFHLHSEARAPLTRSSASPNTARPSPVSADKDRGRGADGGGAGRSGESWNSGGVSSGEVTLPRLKASRAASRVKRKVSSVMGRKEKSV